MAKDVLHIANFGTSKAGLLTVGFTVYNDDGSEHSARSTTGVSELGTNTGIYSAKVVLPNDGEFAVVWDTGEATPRYAVETYKSQLNSIQDSTDIIR